MVLVARRALACAFVSVLFLAAPAFAQDTAAEEEEQQQAAPPAPRAPQGVEEMTVTATKREENIQDIPISVTAFDTESLDTEQIDSVSDLQFNIPNVSYTKGNFNGAGNFAIRGIGSLVVAASGDPATGIHVNQVPFVNARIFETEFFDVERIEVLRGPQGTLYGRSSPAGTVNVITRKPGTEAGGYAIGEYGNFDRYRFEGAATYPILGDYARLRLAGYFLDRDGYTDNKTTGTEIDDRNVWALRGTLAGDIGENTDYSLMVQYFEEDDMNSRISGQSCKRDTNPFPFSLGCQKDELGDDAINYQATLAYQLGLVMLSMPVPELFLNPAAPAFDLYGEQLGVNEPREVRSQFDPIYEADEFVGTFELNHTIGDLKFTSISGYHQSWVYSQTDYFWAEPQFPFGEGPRHYDFPRSRHDFSGTYNSEFVFDQSDGKDWQWSTELHVASSFDGPVNFTAGGIWNSLEANANYWVWAASLERFWDSPQVSAFVFRCPGTFDPNTFLPTGVTCHDVNPHGSFYLNESVYNLRSLAGFGEVYYDILENLKLTLGARYTKDKKTVTSRGGNLFVCFDTDGNPANGIQGCTPDPYQHQEDEWTKWTWKVGLDYNLTDDILFYGTVSTGFKGGGFNPPVASNATRSFSDVFDVENIDAYEIGNKATFLDGTLLLNTSVFFYDYEGLQISKIQNRTSINENIDAEIWGAELESVWFPFESFSIDLNVSWIDTEVQDATSFDPSDPCADVPGCTPIKNPDFNGSNSVVPPGVNPADCLPLFAGALSGIGTCAAFTNTAGGNPLPVGFDKDLSGNNLPGAAEWKINVGATYTIQFASGWEAAFRATYYWQDSMYGRIFNEGRDEIDSWEQINSQIVLRKDRWTFTLWGQNLTDNDDVTGHYFTDETSANFTNLFLLDPRTYGVTVRYEFGGEDN